MENEKGSDLRLKMRLDAYATTSKRISKIF